MPSGSTLATVDIRTTTSTSEPTRASTRCQTRAFLRGSSVSVCPCPGMRLRADIFADKPVSIRIPRRCLKNPGSVRVAVQSRTSPWAPWIGPWIAEPWALGQAVLARSWTGSGADHPTHLVPSGRHVIKAPPGRGSRHRGRVGTAKSGGLGSVVASAEAGEVGWMGLARWSAVAGIEIRLDVVLVAGAGVDPAAGCRSRRVTISRIHGGGSCSSTASPRPMSRTGWMVTWAWPTQSRIFAIVAGARVHLARSRAESALVDGGSAAEGGNKRRLGEGQGPQATYGRQNEALVMARPRRPLVGVSQARSWWAVAPQRATEGHGERSGSLQVASETQSDGDHVIGSEAAATTADGERSAVSRPTCLLLTRFRDGR